MSGTGSDPKDPQVEDPGEYNQRQRLREISQARRNARKALADTFPEFSEDEHRQFALKNVQALAAELEWLVRDSGGDEYFEQQIGAVMLQEPGLGEFEEKVKEMGYGGGAKRILGADSLEPKQISVQGLYSSPDTGMGFIDLPAFVSAEWSTNVDIRHRGPEDVTVTQAKYVPLEVSMAANRLCRKFIHEAGLDARIEKERDDDPNPI